MPFDSQEILGKADEAFRVKDYEHAIRLYQQVVENGEQGSVLVARNLLGKVYEKTDQINEAEKLYQKNVMAGDEGRHPYERLAVIYKKQKRIEDEIGILNHAIDFFQRYYNEDPARIRILETISLFKKRLDQALKRKLDPKNSCHWIY